MYKFNLNVSLFRTMICMKCRKKVLFTYLSLFSRSTLPFIIMPYIYMRQNGRHEKVFVPLSSNCFYRFCSRYKIFCLLQCDAWERTVEDFKTFQIISQNFWSLVPKINFRKISIPNSHLLKHEKRQRSELNSLPIHRQPFSLPLPHMYRLLLSSPHCSCVI